MDSSGTRDDAPAGSLMPRIRSIKPEFFSDEKLAPLDPITRLVAIALVSMADDAGRLLDNVKIIDAYAFPSTDDTAREALANLSRAGFILRGKTASGQAVIQIRNWKRHQRVDHPNLQAALPELVEQQPDADIREALASDSRDAREPLATRSTIYDLRSTIYDQLPTPSPRDELGSEDSLRSSEPDALIDLSERLHQGGQGAMDAEAWRRFCEACMAGMGMPGGRAVSLGAVLAGMEDYLAKRPTPENFNFARACIASAERLIQRDNRPGATPAYPAPSESEKWGTADEWAAAAAKLQREREAELAAEAATPPRSVRRAS